MDGNWFTNSILSSLLNFIGGRSSDANWMVLRLTHEFCSFVLCAVIILRLPSTLRFSLLLLHILWLHLPRAPGVVMTTSVLLGWWMLGLWSGCWSCLYTHLGGRHKRARPRLPSHPHHIPITFPISHFPTTYVATHTHS